MGIEYLIISSQFHSFELMSTEIIHYKMRKKVLAHKYF